MAMRLYSVVSIISFVLSSAAITFGTRDRAFAENECIEQPDREPAQGEHWYYRYDREKNRRCWHLEATASKTREAAPPQTDRTETSTKSTIGSVFSSMLKKWPILAPKPMPQQAAVGEPRIIQSDPAKPLTIEDIAQRQPDIPEEHAEPRYVTPLTPAQRRALFEDYLKWEELQRSLGSSGAPARSP